VHVGPLAQEGRDLTVVALDFEEGEVARVALTSGGDFAIAYVAEGGYILRAVANSEPLPAVNMNADGGVDIASGAGALDTANQDGAAEMPIMVTGEVAGVTIAVPDPPAAKPEPSPSPSEANPPSPQ
jgi:hypothetical protein